MNQAVAGQSSARKRKIGQRRKKLLGPVPNLEEHVSPDWWRGIFNSLYLKTDGDVVDDRNITVKEINQFVDILDLKTDNNILDLCCGHGRHSIELAKRGFRNAEGLDRSHYLISKAKNVAGKDNLNVKFKEGDARKLPYPADTFDAVMILGNSFGYFETIQDDVRILKEVFRVLKPWGRLLIDITNGDYLKNNFKPRSWEWIGKKHFVCRERSLSVDGQRLISREIVTDVEKGVTADQFYAERLYSESNLDNLLTHAGFCDVTVHGEIHADSQRNQDLGMMEKRLIVTALVKKEWSSLKVKNHRETKNVTVILGDPAKPDPLKPLSVFDDDDFYTIDQMKAALRTLKKYKISYINNHDRMIDDIRKLSGKTDFVFNLCDEGYFNDPGKELHVPSLLEAFGIPYTGAGPQCLAYCYDKSLVRGVAKEMGIPVPEAFFIEPEDTTFDLPLAFPVLAKPNFGDSSFGITQRSVAVSLENLLNAIEEIREKLGYEKPIIVEEFLGGMDITVGIIGNPPSSYHVLPIIEEDYSALPDYLPKICGYEAKWDPGSPYWNLKSIPAELPRKAKNMIVEGCLKLFERLECRDYARFDWRLDTKGNPKLLEVNPNPGWCWDGHLAKMAKLEDISYTTMLAMILQSAEQRLGL
ncbi:methyltransferase domain-containing protein [Verrucomicrobiota bacterium]